MSDATRSCIPFSFSKDLNPSSVPDPPPRYFDHHPEEEQNWNAEFPNIYCWSLPHIIHVGVCATSFVLFVVLALLMVMAEMELNPLSRNYLAIAHSRCVCVCVYITSYAEHKLAHRCLPRDGL